MADNYNHTPIEKKWQDKWEKGKLYVPDVRKAKSPFYNLWMFPYPSAEGLHAGHAFASTGSDVFGRFMRMQGKNVFQPIGYDSFGIHSENYAIKIGEDPHKVVKRTTKHYEEQMRSLGHGYDWTRTVTTSDPDYYRYTQWLFVKMFEAGLAYKKKATVNFCPSCKTVLADEQVMSPSQAGKAPLNSSGEVVENGGDLKVCERCGTIVEKRDLDQWFFKITNYADKLLSGLSSIDWSEKVKVAQKNWIGKSEGMLIKFKIEKGDGEFVEVFTTRPDTLNAVTFIATADETLYNEENPEKIGEFTGKYAIEPLSGRKIPIWKTNYVAPGYGTGNVMGVPAHDERDMEFASKYHLDIIEKDPDDSLWEEGERQGWGKKHTNYHLRDWLVSRQRYWGAPIPIIYCHKCLENDKLQITNDKFQTTEIDGVKYAVHAVPEKDLPVLLPSISDYKPEGTGKGPLANHPDFYKTTCPNCGGPAVRETDVMDTFVDSSWYYLRYPSVPQFSVVSSQLSIKSQSVDRLTGKLKTGKPDTENRQQKTDNTEYPFDPEITRAWLPVDLYFGGAEHSVLHLMYARFVTMVLRDLGYLDFEEPFTKFFAHGLMIKDGAKMSKSRGNVVNPDEYIEKYGADTLRLYLMFMGPMDASPDFRDSGIEGMRKFVNRLWKLFSSSVLSSQFSVKGQSVDRLTGKLKTGKPNTENRQPITDNRLLSKLHQTIKKVTEDMYNFKYNTAIASLMELVNTLENQFSVLSSQFSVKGQSVDQLAGKLKTDKPDTENRKLTTDDRNEVLSVLCRLIAPFAPHLAEEVWVEVLGQPFSVHKSEWPKYDSKYLKEDQTTIIVQVNGKVRGLLTLNTQLSTDKQVVEQTATKDANIMKWLKDVKIKQTIFVPGKLINFVI